MAISVQVRVGYAHLEEALALLEEAKLADGKLASEIQEGLRQLKPDCVIEHLRVKLHEKSMKSEVTFTAVHEPEQICIPMVCNCLCKAVLCSAMRA